MSMSIHHHHKVNTVDVVMQYNYQYSCIGIVIVLGCQSYHNNSIVTLTDIAEGDRALLCFTDETNCCGGSRDMRMGEWYYPNGSVVERDRDGARFYRNRSTSVVRLHQRGNTAMPTGVFHCEVPVASGVNQRTYIGVYPEGEGE